MTEHRPQPEQSDLKRRWPAMISADERYAVLPQHVLAQLPSALQHQLASLMDRVHQTMSDSSWLTYRVVPSRYARLDELDEPGLREAGVSTELGSDGELVYRNIETGQALTETQLAQLALVSCEHAGPAAAVHAS